MAISDTFKNLPPEKQQRILDQALTEFAQNGYGKASINTLVSRLGISKGSIFQYFGDKAGLLAEVFALTTAEVVSRLEEAVRLTKGQDFLDRFGAMVMAAIHLQEESAQYMTLYLRIAYEEDVPDSEGMQREMRASIHNLLSELLLQGRADGQIGQDVDLRMAALLTMAVFERFIVARAMDFKDLGAGIYRADIGQVRDMVAEAMDILRRGMGAPLRGPGAVFSPQAMVRLYSSFGEGEMSIPPAEQAQDGQGGGSSTFRNLPEAKQKRIMHEALNEFAERGYAKASLNSLVSKVGISKGSIFQYFKDKANLFYTVFHFALGAVVGPLRLLRDETKDQDLFTRLYLSLLAGFDLISNRPHLFRLYLATVHDAELPLRGVLLESLTKFSGRYMHALFEDGRRAGDTRDELDAQMAPLVALAVLERLMVAQAVEHKDLGLGLYQADMAEARRIGMQAIDLLRRGLGADS